MVHWLTIVVVVVVVVVIVVVIAVVIVVVSVVVSVVVVIVVIVFIIVVFVICEQPKAISGEEVTGVCITNYERLHLLCLLVVGVVCYC